MAELQGGTASLGAGPFDAGKIIALSADPGTHEQFHAQFKTDLDLERRHIKAMMQESIHRAGRLIETGRRPVLGLGANGRTARDVDRLHGELFAAATP